MGYIRWFQDIKAGEIELVGGKGANLGELARADFPVPPGFCLVARAYQEVVDANSLYPSIQAVIDQTNMDDPQDVSEKMAHIRKLITHLQFPKAMVDEIVAGYHQLNREVGLPTSNAVPVAIRSSATAEDLPSASFAGQQDTYLNIRGEQALLDSIRRCWASLWTARSVTYRAQHGFDHDKVYVSVVVQAMVEAEVSGVLFTANPVNGDRQEAVINASWGLGEAIVSGMVSPDTLTVDKGSSRILRRQTALKDCLLVYSEDGGTLEIETPEEKRLTPTLTDQQAAELIALGIRIEQHFGRPQDIEWSYANEKWYVLQARPITNLETTEIALDIDGNLRTGEYSRVMLVEIIPDALSPVFLSVLLPLIQRMFEYTFNTLGFKVPKDIDAVAGFYYQPYFHRQYIEQTLSSLSPAVRRRMVEQYINPISHEKQHSIRELSPAYVGMILRMVRFMLWFPNHLPRILERYKAEVNEMAAKPISQTTDPEIVNHILSLVFDTVSSLLNYDFLIIALTGRFYNLLESLLKPYYGEQAEEIVKKLNTGLEGNVTMETNMGLWNLAQVAKSSPVVVNILTTIEPDQVGAYLQETSEGSAFLSHLDRFLQKFGHREIRFDIIYPTWVEDPTPIFGFVRSYLETNEEHSPLHQQSRLIAERQQLTKEVTSRISQNLKGKLLINPIFRWLLAQSHIYTRERDTMHFEWTRIFPPTRRFLVELGRRWEERDLLEHRDDIFMMRYTEIKKTAFSPAKWHEAAARRQEFDAANSRTWPEIIRHGHPIYLGNAHETTTSDNDLRGVAGSPGLVTGVGRVIRGPEDFNKLRPGEILIAPLTNPVWTPLFAVAGGVVTEVGGILSHGAIVAREYGIPAVMSVAGATTKIKDDQVVTVDGNRGLVRIEGELSDDQSN